MSTNYCTLNKEYLKLNHLMYIQYMHSSSTLRFRLADQLEVDLLDFLLHFRLDNIFDYYILHIYHSPSYRSNNWYQLYMFHHYCYKHRQIVENSFHLLRIADYNSDSNVGLHRLDRYPVDIQLKYISQGLTITYLSYHNS